MNGRYAVTASRIRQDLDGLERLVEQVERAVVAASAPNSERDLLLDSAALNLHDFYSALERIFELIASGVDRSLPEGHEWHRALLQQMTEERLETAEAADDAAMNWGMWGPWWW